MAAVLTLGPAQHLDPFDIEQFLVQPDILGQIHAVDVHGDRRFTLRVGLADAADEQLGVEIGHGHPRLEQIGRDVAEFADAGDALLLELQPRQAGDRDWRPLHRFVAAVPATGDDKFIDTGSFGVVGHREFRSDSRRPCRHCTNDRHR